MEQRTKKKKRERNDENSCLIGFLRGQFVDSKSKIEELPNFLTKTYTPKLSVFMTWYLNNEISEQTTASLIFSLMANNMFLGEKERRKYYLSTKLSNPNLSGTTTK